MLNMYQNVRGMRDFTPVEMRKRDYVFTAIKKVFEQYGFEPLDTPAVESFALLAGKGGAGEEIKKEIYHFKDQSDRAIGLRFDLTVPTARFVANNPDMPKPFKRYMIAKVWRYDRPQAGRYREFTQADIDVFGAGNTQTDFEIFAVTVDIFKALGFKDFEIRVNNKKLLSALILAAGIPKKKELDALRSIDKFDKIGWDGVKTELETRDVPNADKLIELIKDNQLKKEFEEFEVGKEGIQELNDFMTLVKESGLEKYAKIDLSIVRGLEYYTGIVYEVKAGGSWSCGGGGRYDNMIEQYGGRPTPANGISYGIERVIQLMDEQGLMPELLSSEIFVAAVNDSMRGKAREIAATLRKKGKRVETDLANRSLRKQFDYVNSKNIPTCIIIGTKDLEKGLATVRDMTKGEEKQVKLEEL